MKKIDDLSEGAQEAIYVVGGGFGIAALIAGFLTALAFWMQSVTHDLRVKRIEACYELAALVSPEQVEECVQRYLPKPKDE